MSYDVKVQHEVEQPAAVVHGHVAMSAISEFLGGAYGDVSSVLAAQGNAVAGPPFGVYRISGDSADVTAGFPCTTPVDAFGRVGPWTLPGGLVAATVHRGRYDTIGPAYAAVVAWLGEHDFVPSGEPWESYLDGPEVPEPRTRVCFPCQVKDGAE